MGAIGRKFYSYLLLQGGDSILAPGGAISNIYAILTARLGIRLALAAQISGHLDLLQCQPVHPQR
jgi:hypothetical protein